jgi:hypothetical protein
MGAYLSIWLIQHIHLDKKDQWNKTLTKHFTQAIKYINNKFWDYMWPWHLYIHVKHFDMEFKRLSMQLFNIYMFDCNIYVHNLKMYMCEHKVLFTKFEFNFL